MADKEQEVGVYINISAALDNKLALIARLLPRKKNGKRWFKKEVIAKACELYADKFITLLNGAADIDDMLAKAKEIDPDAIEIEIGESATDKPAPNIDLLKETAGLSEF